MTVPIIFLAIGELILAFAVVFIIRYYDKKIAKLWKEILDVSDDLTYLYEYCGRIKQHDETLSNQWCRINQLEIKFNHFQRRVK